MKKLILITVLLASCKIQQKQHTYLPEQVKKEELKKDQQIGIFISGVGILFFLILFY